MVLKQAGMLSGGKLPIIATVIEAIGLPIIYWRDFIKFACVPVAIYALQFLLHWNNAPQKHPLLLLLIVVALSLSMIPFQVTWIRLAVNGADSISRRRIWSLGQVECKYLAAAAVLALVPQVPACVAMIVAMVVMTKVMLAVPLMLLALGLFIAGIAWSIRLSFVLVELALERYDGWRNSWNQTKGLSWRLIAISILAMLPFGVAGAICGAIQADGASHVGWLVLTIIGQSTLTVLTSAATLGGLAIAYRLTSPEPPAAAISMS
ncbi:MAG TPA: hypothetical protein VHY56_14845 [Candidatus Binataceae bacterium]|nr:hypothetical protein [Candidatus Binataceae bacterium]